MRALLAVILSLMLAGSASALTYDCTPNTEQAFTVEVGEENCTIDGDKAVKATSNPIECHLEPPEFTVFRMHSDLRFELTRDMLLTETGFCVLR